MHVDEIITLSLTFKRELGISQLRSYGYLNLILSSSPLSPVLTNGQIGQSEQGERRGEEGEREERRKGSLQEYSNIRLQQLCNLCWTIN